MNNENEKNLFILLYQLYTELLNNNILYNNENKTIELINKNVKLNPLQNEINLQFKKTNKEYCIKELKWYLSQSLSIINYVDDIKIWNNIASKNNKQLVNSNYGWCIFSNENHNQYFNCLNELIKNKNSRRALMIYQRPSMWNDYNFEEKNDFLCTDGVQCFIRNNNLIYIIKQRSCDLIYGFFNDFYWHCYVYNKLYTDLLYFYSDLKIGYIDYNFCNIHIYEKHFDLLKNIIEKFYFKKNEKQ